MKSEDCEEQNHCDTEQFETEVFYTIIKSWNNSLLKSRWLVDIDENILKSTGFMKDE